VHEGTKDVSTAESLPEDVTFAGKDQAVGAATGAAASTGAGGKVLEGVGAEQAVEHKEEMAEYDVKGAQSQVKKSKAAVSDATDATGKKGGGDDDGNVDG
jgi:hypothetical protein